MVQTKTHKTIPASQSEGVYSSQSQDEVKGGGEDVVIVVSVFALALCVHKIGVLKEHWREVRICLAVEFK